MTARLSVNVNKVATLRNTRSLGIPSPLRAAELCLLAGAQGITLHPRPDERHVKLQDVFEIGALLKDWPDREFNLEGNPFHNLLDVVAQLRDKDLPIHQVTFVPDSVDQFTSDHGFDLPRDAENLSKVIEQAAKQNVRISLFMDADENTIGLAGKLGVQRVELYTEPYAATFGTLAQEAQLLRFTRAARAAQEAGLGVNAGHDLNLNNLAPLVHAIPFLAEVSIGHAFIADALELGYSACTKAYLAQLQPV